MERRAVITGIGLRTPLGNSADEFFTNALHGRSGVKVITKFDTSNYPVRIIERMELAGSLRAASRKAALMTRVSSTSIHGWATPRAL